MKPVENGVVFVITFGDTRGAKGTMHIHLDINPKKILLLSIKSLISSSVMSKWRVLLSCMKVEMFCRCMFL